MYPKRSYSERLKDPRWAEFRQRCYGVLVDEYTEEMMCGFCYAPCGESFHLHHKFYVKGREPWEYEPEDMKFLCGKCHTWLHEDALEVWTYMLSSNDYMNNVILETIKELKSLSQGDQHLMWGRFRYEVEHYKKCESKFATKEPQLLHEIMMERPLRPCCRHRFGLPKLHIITRLAA